MDGLIEALIYLWISLIYFSNPHTSFRRAMLGSLALALALVHLLEARDLVTTGLWLFVAALASGNEQFAVALASGIVFAL